MPKQPSDSPNFSLLFPLALGLRQIKRLVVSCKLAWNIAVSLKITARLQPDRAWGLCFCSQCGVHGRRMQGRTYLEHMRREQATIERRTSPPLGRRPPIPITVHRDRLPTAPLFSPVELTQSTPNLGEMPLGDDDPFEDAFEDTNGPLLPVVPPQIFPPHGLHDFRSLWPHSIPNILKNGPLSGDLSGLISDQAMSDLPFVERFIYTIVLTLEGSGVPRCSVEWT